MSAAGAAKKHIYDGLCTVLSAKDEFLNLIDIIAWKIHLVSVYIQYILMTIPDMVYDGLCFLSQQNMSSIIAWKIHLVPVHSVLVCDGLCTVLMPEPAKEELVSPLPFCP